MNSDELVPWIQLSRVPGIGVGLFQRLLERFGAPGRVFDASLKELSSIPGISPRLAAAVLRGSDDGSRDEALREVDRAHGSGVRIITVESPEYPEKLRTIFGPPPILYYRGDPGCLNEPCVAMVGTRRATSAGLRTAESLAADLVAAGVTIVSGLARGIDSGCHEGALRSGGRTVAVLGSGLAFELPKDRNELLERIAQQGLILSEFGMEMAPRPENFPRRNRIISGLSAATVVVEAGERSGALITASFASDQGREVFAVPGRITDPQSAGCNLLIRDGASPVLDTVDILQSVAGKSGRTATGHGSPGKDPVPRTAPQARSAKAPPPSLNEEETTIYELLKDESKHVDEVTRSSDLPPHRVAQLLLSLELKGAVVRESGMRYARS
jgi:DNA processing protein